MLDVDMVTVPGELLNARDSTGNDKDKRDIDYTKGDDNCIV